MVRIYLVRHAEAMGNVLEFFQGRTDTDISPKGEKQLACLAERFKDIDFDISVSQAISSGTEETRRRFLSSALSLIIEIAEPRNLTDNLRIRNLMAKLLEESGLKDTDNYLLNVEKVMEQAKNANAVIKK